MNSEVRHFSPAETATRLGVTVKALRLYEQRGLVTPQRTSAGWRVYGPEQIARLHQVLALKSLGLPLARIAELFASRPVKLDGLLAMQEQALADHRAKLDRALTLLRTARAKLKAGDVLSIDDLTTLAKETSMSDHDAMKAIFDPIAEKHFSPKERDALAARPMQWDQVKVSAEWDALIAECNALMAKGDPTSLEAQNLAGRWMALVSKFTQGDPKLFAKVGAMWGEAMADPVAAPKLPLNPEMFAFIGKADAARKARGG